MDAGNRRRGEVIEAGLRSLTAALERSFFAEGISSRAGLFQSLDPRAKVVMVLALLLAVALSHRLSVLVGLYLLALVLAWASRVPMGYFVGRTWAGVLLFTGLIAVPALFLTPGPPLAHLAFGLTITATGLTTVGFLLLRVTASISFTLLLILTTPWNTVLSALGALRVPDVFTLILGMTYRYIYLLIRSADNLFMSRRSRTVGRLSPDDSRRLLAAVSGTLLNQSLHLSEEVYLAMQSRGFRGTVISLKRFQMRAQDWLWLGLCLGAAALAVFFGRLG
jgi:cobalt/nickel transport system permease protein